MDDQEKEKMWKKIRMLRQLGSKGSTLKRESPFFLVILEEELPASFKKPSVGEYDGSTNPGEHMRRFENDALLHQYSDDIKCLVFLRTLEMFAQNWFNMLNPVFIKFFEDFSVVYMNQFSSSKKYQNEYLSLFVMKQLDQETLREFIQRFNGVALEVPTSNPDILISAFTQGLKGGEFFKSLVKKLPSSYDDLLARAEKYVNLEDAQRYRRTEKRKRGSNVEEKDKNSSKRQSGVSITPEAISGSSLDKSKNGEAKKREGGSGSFSRIDQRRRRTDETNNPTRGMIHMISGGATDSDSGRARKAHGRRMENFEISKELNPPQDPIISFGPEDLCGVVVPHNDALMGTSVNMLFKGTLDQMKIEGFELKLISTPLYGFTGHAIQPLGHIDLPVTMGNDPRRVTKMVSFTVVDAPLSYNGILGRQAMKDFIVVASTYKEKLEFCVGIRRWHTDVMREWYAKKEKKYTVGG
ncbi:uncharacterized protein [Henckelia pumila]|uniref:uncharacterized protein n=1 Tax=Henckelia pumila TaxID=405737 RepID=UPI003C6E1800